MRYPHRIVDIVYIAGGIVCITGAILILCHLDWKEVIREIKTVGIA